MPYEPLSRSDAEKAHNKQAREVVDALEHAGIVTKQSGGRLRGKWELVLAGLEARRRGFCRQCRRRLRAMSPLALCQSGCTRVTAT